MADHSKGPWEIKVCGDDARIDATHDECPWWGLASVVIRVDGEPDAQGEANAHLIAAAPDLLEALEAFRGYGCPVCSGDCGSANPPVASCPMSMANAAIAKARNHPKGSH